MGAQICPNCKSTNVTLANGGFRQLIGMEELYECNDCGYKGYLFPEAKDIDDNEKEVLADMNKEFIDAPFVSETKKSSKLKIVLFALFWLGIPSAILLLIFIAISIFIFH